MIFLSHNYKDKPIVEQVAIKLREIYGQDNIFYDSWSIQPGEGIIDKMEQGLTNCKFFFFFISANSLNSNMVKLEWQNALYKAAQNTIKFIPIRLDQSQMPSLLMQSLYIDLFSNGLDICIRQFVDVINGANTFREAENKFSNLAAYKYWENGKLIIECHALHYLEPITEFAYLTFNNISDINTKCISHKGFHMNGSATNPFDFKSPNGTTLNSISKAVPSGTVPGLPFVVEFSPRVGEPIDIALVLHRVGTQQYEGVKIINGKKQ